MSVNSLLLQVCMVVSVLLTVADEEKWDIIEKIPPGKNSTNYQPVVIFTYTDEIESCLDSVNVTYGYLPASHNRYELCKISLSDKTIACKRKQDSVHIDQPWPEDSLLSFLETASISDEKMERVVRPVVNCFPELFNFTTSTTRIERSVSKPTEVINDMEIDGVSTAQSKIMETTAKNAEFMAPNSRSTSATKLVKSPVNGSEIKMLDVRLHNDEVKKDSSKERNIVAFVVMLTLLVAVQIVLAVLLVFIVKHLRAVSQPRQEAGHSSKKKISRNRRKTSAALKKKEIQSHTTMMTTMMTTTVDLWDNPQTHMNKLGRSKRLSAKNAKESTMVTAPKTRSK